MVSSTLSLATAVGLLAIQPATAGFVIYLGKSNDVVPGEGTGGGGVNSSISKALFYNQKPKEGCDGTAQEMTINGYGDVTMGRGGWVCDGCGVADNTDDDGNDYPDRFEVNDEDGDVFEGGGHITLYKDEGAHTYGMYDTDMNRVGDCESPEDRDSVTCAHAIFGIDSAVMYFTCESEDYNIVDSN